jgi:hypothetical protein
MSGDNQEKKVAEKSSFLEKVFGILAGHALIRVGGPTGIPAFIGKRMVVELQHLPAPENWVRYLMVIRQQNGKPNTYDLRVIDEFQINNKNNKIVVSGYDFLDDHPELIKMEGWFNSRSHEVHVKARVPAN